MQLSCRCYVIWSSSESQSGRLFFCRFWAQVFLATILSLTCPAIVSKSADCSTQSWVAAVWGHQLFSSAVLIYLRAQGQVQGFFFSNFIKKKYDSFSLPYAHAVVITLPSAFTSLLCLCKFTSFIITYVSAESSAASSTRISVKLTS